MLWGVDDATHDPVGTDFDPWSSKKGSEDLIPWLTRAVDPQVEPRFGSAPYPEGRAVVLRVEAAHHNPVKFKGRAFIRVDSYKKLLTDNPEYERRLWKRLGSKQFERGVALDGLEPGDVTQLLDLTIRNAGAQQGPGVQNPQGSNRGGVVVPPRSHRRPAQHAVRALLGRSPALIVDSSRAGAAE